VFFVLLIFLSSLLASRLIEEDRSSQHKTSSEDLSEELAGGTVEIISIPAGTADTSGQKNSAVVVGGVGNAGQWGTSEVNSVVSLAVVAVSTGLVVAVGHSGTRAGGVGGVTGLALVAQVAVSNVGRSSSLVDRSVLAVSDLSKTGWLRNARTLDWVGVGGSLPVLAVVAHSHGPRDSVGVGSGERAGIELDVSGSDVSVGKLVQAGIGSKVSGSDTAGSPVVALSAHVGGTAGQAVVGSGAGTGHSVGSDASNDSKSEEFHFVGVDLNV